MLREGLLRGGLSLSCSLSPFVGETGQAWRADISSWGAGSSGGAKTKLRSAKPSGGLRDRDSTRRTPDGPLAAGVRGGVQGEGAPTGGWIRSVNPRVDEVVEPTEVRGREVELHRELDTGAVRLALDASSGQAGGAVDH